jgi:hypothetical protein
LENTTLNRVFDHPGPMQGRAYWMTLLLNIAVKDIDIVVKNYIMRRTRG